MSADAALPLADNCKPDDGCTLDDVLVPKADDKDVQNSLPSATTDGKRHIVNEGAASNTPPQVKKQQLGGLMSILKAGLWNNVLKFEGASGAAVNAPFVSKTKCARSPSCYS